MLPHRPEPPEESIWSRPGTLIWGISADADCDLLLGLGDSGQRDFFLQSPEEARGLACPAGAGRRLQIPLPAENIETHPEFSIIRVSFQSACARETWRTQLSSSSTS